MAGLHAYMCRHCDANNKQEEKNKEKIKAVRTREVPLENAQTLYYLNEKPMGVKSVDQEIDDSLRPLVKPQFNEVLVSSPKYFFQIKPSECFKSKTVCIL